MILTDRVGIVFVTAESGCTVPGAGLNNANVEIKLRGVATDSRDPLPGRLSMLSRYRKIQESMSEADN